MVSGRYPVAPAALECAVVLGATLAVGTYGLQETTSTLSANLTTLNQNTDLQFKCSAFC